MPLLQKQKLDTVFKKIEAESEKSEKKREDKKRFTVS